MSDDQLKNTESRFRPALMFIGVIVAIIAVDVWNKTRTGSTRHPGSDRGDIRVTADCLKATIGNWQQSDFQPPKAEGEEPNTQWWWSHTWQYNSDGTAALVSFDQLGLDVWHELTSCYRASGWELLKREIIVGPPANHMPWKFVRAEFTKDDGSNAVVLFSSFFADGTPCVPEKISHDGKFIFEMNPLEKVQEAIANQRHAQEQGFVTGRGRVLQCQVLYGDTSEGAVEDSLRLLHLDTRESIRQEWLQQTTKTSPSQ